MNTITFGCLILSEMNYLAGRKQRAGVWTVMAIIAAAIHAWDVFHR